MGAEEEEEEEEEEESDSITNVHEDLYAFILESSRISASQEQLLKTTPFVGEQMASQQTDADLPVSSAPILMVTPPDSQDGPQDVFHTPPEEASLASSDDQRRTVAVDVDFEQCPVNQEVDVDAGSQVFVDLVLGFSDGSETVDLGNESGLGFSQTQLKQEIDAKLVPDSAGGADEDGLGEIPKRHLDEFEVLETEISDLSDSPVKKLKLSAQDLGEVEENAPGCEQVSVDSGKEDDFCREIPMDKDLGKEQKFDETEVDQLKSVTSAGDVNNEVAEGSGMRVLPISISCGLENAANDEKEEASEGTEKNKIDVLSLLRALAENSDGVKGYEEEGITLFEAAKRAGVTFPRPRWWPDSFDENGQIKKTP